ncbi:MAG: hypothetical protein L3K26_20610, partial [Candidatus Hydrogenedentes bacterium]|nr:hypothetical protein [Candidatus Hydrogenedentota bacterium]
FFRGDLFTTVLLSSRTLAVVRPKQPTRYIKQADCVAYQPGTDSSSSRLILRDGTQVGFGLADIIPEPPGPMLTIWRRWWPYIPEEKLTVLPLRWLITLCVVFMGLMLFFYGAAQRSDSLILLSFTLLLGVPIYYAIRFFRKPYTISLRAEDYPDKT